MVAAYWLVMADLLILVKYLAACKAYKSLMKLVHIITVSNSGYCLHFIQKFCLALFVKFGVKAYY